MPQSASADGSNETKDGIRFVQVAAGEDFAIGLTVKGDLYGWSLIEGRGNAARTPTDAITSDGSNAATLGEYYTETPTKINVVFRQGPGVGSTIIWTDTSSNGYHKVVDDTIKKIVATRTTAAFLTENGYVYTWGKDTYSNNTIEGISMEDLNPLETRHYLLLREVNSSDYPWQIPYIINYNYYTVGGSVDGMNTMRPSWSANAKVDIAAGEYNYIMTGTKDVTASSGSTTAQLSYVWGSLLYSNVNIEQQTENGQSAYSYTPIGGSTTNAMKGGVQARKIVSMLHIQGQGTNTVSNVVAGGYNVGFNNSSADSGSTSLQLRGRNFITSRYEDGVVNTVEVYNDAASTLLHAEGNVTNGIIGGKGAFSTESVFDVIPSTYYGRVSSGGDALIFAANSNVGIADAFGNELGISKNDVLLYSVERFGVSLGNDVGYGVTPLTQNAGGELYAWGDNAHGQLGTAAAEGNYFKQTPVKINISGSRFVSVAAGKQLSADDKPYYNTTTLTTSESGTSFRNNVVNGSEFITGALDSTGRLYVWSNNNSTPQEITYGGVESANVQLSTNGFAAVYSGYGNNLFAVTKIGKLVRVQYKDSGYSLEYYDTFNTGSGNMTNWEVDNSNVISFIPKAAPTVGKTDPDLGSATIYVWQSTAVSNAGEAESDLGTVIFQHKVVGASNADGFTPLVSSNEIGDVYRILGTSDNDHTYLTHKLAVNESDSFAPKFSYKSGSSDPVAMTEKQCENMFTLTVVKNENGLGLTIKPKKSSRGYTIIMDFYIARYSASANFTAAADNAVYYDYRQCSIEFTIADTSTVQIYNSFDAESGNCNIPLLDPNNESNKYYSLAVQNVSAGIPALLTYLNKGVALSGNAAAFTALTSKMTAADAGFPASAKISAGNLTYYLGNDAAKLYKDQYQYLYEDRDGDRIIISKTGAVISAAGATGTITTIHITDVDTGIALVGDIADAQKALITDFENTYGLYNIKLTTSDTNTIVLAFDYDVLRVEGTGSTNGSGIIYSGDSVSSYVTSENNATARAGVNAKSYPVNYADGTNNFATIGEGVEFFPDEIAVFSAPTLRISKGMGVNTEAGTIYDGSATNANNEFTVEYNNHLYVGESVEIQLPTYFVDRNSFISFAYKNATTQAAYNSFNGQFVDQTGYNIKPVVLSASSLVVTPTTTEPIYITLTVQRFRDANHTETFKRTVDGVEVVDEKITINFIFGNNADNSIRGFEFTKTASNNPASTRQLITRSETFDILGAKSTISNKTSFITVSITGIGADDAKIADLLKLIKVTDISTTEDNKEESQKLFKVTDNKNQTFTVTPLSSGSGTIQFIATLYNKSLVFTLNVNIAAKTLVGDSIIVDADQYVYIDSIKSVLEKSNAINNTPFINIANYNVLTNDIAGAIYFTETPGAGEDAKTEIPSFIRNVAFEGLNDGGSPNIRVVSNTTTESNAKTYYMHVKLTNAANATTYDNLPAGSVIEAVYPIVSGKARIPVEIEIDVTNSENRVVPNSTTTAGGNPFTGINMNVSGEGMGMSVKISVQDLLDYLEREHASEYKIIIISADESVSNYFTYATADSDKSILLMPVNNTPLDDSGFPTALELQASLYYNNYSVTVSFNVSVSGILTVLPVMKSEGTPIGYGNIWIYSALIVFGFLAVIFIIRFLVYFKKRAQQRAIIKRNQDLIRMRDRMHNKGTTATREQVVKTRLKMDDPKYAKMFREMKKSRTEENGGLVVDDDLATAAVDPKNKKKSKKKKGGKKTVAELKAELEAKKAAFAAAQAQSAQPVDPFAQDVPMDGGAFDGSDATFVNPDGGFDGVMTDDFGGAQSIDGSEIIFDATDVGDGE